jgi:glutamyl-tRNA reductase
MSLLTVGLSHRTAPVSVLERVAISSVDVPKLLDELASSESISEVLIVSTCNRVEITADVSRFHPAVAEISGVFARTAGAELGALGDHLYVHFAEAAAEHMLSVASGLDSMVIGESQILGQLREAYAVATEAATVGRTLHDVVQTALRTGKRVHSETGIDRAGASIVSVALDRAEQVIGRLDGARVFIVGAGAMGALSAATAARRGVGDIVVTNRSYPAAQRVARAVSGRAVRMDSPTALHHEIAAADVLISCTGSTGLMWRADDVPARSDRPLAVLDLALPRDVDPAVGERDGIHYIDLGALREAGAMVSDSEVAAARVIVAGELQDYLDEQQKLAVAPTVTALRARASQVVDAELSRLDGRLPELDARSRAEVAAAVRRAVEKVLHAPTVRVKELAATPDGDKYAAALRALFDLDPASTESVAGVRGDLTTRPGGEAG